MLPSRALPYFVDNFPTDNYRSKFVDAYRAVDAYGRGSGNPQQVLCLIESLHGVISSHPQPDQDLKLSAPSAYGDAVEQPLAPSEPAYGAVVEASSPPGAYGSVAEETGPTDPVYVNDEEFSGPGPAPHSSVSSSN